MLLKTHGLRNEMYLRSQLAWERLSWLSGIFKAEVFLISCQKHMSMLSDPVEPLQPNGYLVAQPVGKTRFHGGWGAPSAHDSSKGIGQPSISTMHSSRDSTVRGKEAMPNKPNLSNAKHALLEKYLRGNLTQTLVGLPPPSRPIYQGRDTPNGPHPASLRIDPTKEAWLAHFEIWLRVDMPRLNMQILAKEADIDTLRDQIQHFVDTFPSIETLTHTQKVQALQYCGFAISSMERHSQDRGSPVGQGLARVTGAEPLLLALGEQTGYPPRDILYTYTTINRPNTITFSSDPQEELFIDVLNQSGDYIKMAGDLIRPITRGQMRIDTPQATQVLIQAVQALECARRQFLRCIEVVNPQTGQFALSIPFFRDVLRPFTCDWFIGGQEWTGVSAADAVEFKKLDYLIGTIDDHFKRYVLNRMKYLPPRQKAELVDDMQSPSLLDGVMRALGLSPQVFASLSEVELTGRLKEQSHQGLQFIKQYVKLVALNGRLSATHWSLLANYLIKPTEVGQGKELKGDEHGTAHITFSDIITIRDMRRFHSQVKKLSGTLENLH